MSPASPQSTPRSHSWIVAAISGAALFALSLWLYEGYGITWDEEIQQRYGEALLRYYASLGRDQSLFGIRNLRDYGGLFELLAALAARLTPDSVYETRHLVNAAVGSLAVVAACRIGTRLAGALAGALAAAFLTLTPLYFGHLFNNPKDTPFAAAIALSIAALLGGWGELPRLGRTRVLLAGGAAGMALGIRPAALPVLAVLWATFCAAWLLARRGEPGTWSAETVRRLALSFLQVAALAFCVMLAFWPWGQRSPLRASLDAFPLATGINRRGTVLFNGQLVTSRHLPWSYVPLWLVATLPEFLLIALLAGAAAVFARRRSGQPAAAPDRGWKIAWLVTTALVPIASAIVLRPSLYDGVRHFIFILPSLAVLAAVGLVSFSRSKLALGVRVLVAALVASFACWTARDMIRLHPYQSVYFNRLVGGGVAHAAERFEMDYWCSSYKDAAEWLMLRYGQGLERKVRVAGLYAPQAASYYLMKSETGRRRFLPVSLDDNPHVVIATTRWGTWAALRGRILHVVEREGAPLGYVIETRQPQPFFVRRPRPGDPRIVLPPASPLPDPSQRERP